MNVVDDASWVLPDWMEPYRDLIESDLGGNSIENLLNDTTTNGFNNLIRAALISMGDAKVRMLHGLRQRDLLAPVAVETVAGVVDELGAA